MPYVIIGAICLCVGIVIGYIIAKTENDYTP